MSELIHQLRGKRFWISVLWPSFVCAGVFSGLAFAFIDPLELAPLLFVDESNTESDLRLGGYSMVFLYFWIVGAASICAAVGILPPGKQTNTNLSISGDD